MTGDGAGGRPVDMVQFKQEAIDCDKLGFRHVVLVEQLMEAPAPVRSRQDGSSSVAVQRRSHHALDVRNILIDQCRHVHPVVS
jgi:hypothetical protein